MEPQSRELMVPVCDLMVVMNWLHVFLMDSPLLMQSASVLRNPHTPLNCPSQDQSSSLPFKKDSVIAPGW